MKNSKLKRNLPQSKIKNLRQYLALLSLIISVVSTVIIVFFFYVQIQHFMTEENKEAAKQTLVQSTDILEKDLNNASNILLNIENNEVILSSLEQLKNFDRSAMDRYEASQQLRNYLFKLSQGHHIIEDIIVITPESQFSASGFSGSYALNGVQMSENSDSSHLYTVTDFLEDTNLSEEISGKEFGSVGPYLNNKFFFAANIQDSDKRIRGVALILINPDELTKYLLTQERYRIVLDEQAILYEGKEFEFSADPTLLQEADYIKLANNEYFSQSLVPNQLKVIYQVDANDYLNFKQTLLLLVLASFIIYQFAYFLSRRISNTVIEPIHELLHWMDNQKASSEKFKINYSGRSSSFSFVEKLMGYFLLTIIFPVILVSTLYYSQTTHAVTEEMRQIIHMQHQSKAEILNQEMDRLKKVLALFSSEFGVTSFTSLRNIDEASLNDFKNTYLSPFNNETVSVYSNDGELLVSSGKHTKQSIDMSEFVSEANGSRFLYSVGVDMRAERMLSIALPIFRSYDPDENLGVVVVNVKADFFNSLPIIEGIDNEYVVIDDKFKWEMNASKIDLIDKGSQEDNEDQFRSSLNLSNWEYISVLNQASLETEIRNIFLSHSYMLFLLTLMLAVVSYLLTKSVMKPFNMLIHSYHPGQSERWKAQSIGSFMEVDEIERLKRNFEEGLLKLNDLADEKQTIQEQFLLESFKKREIQLFAIQNQVNPHFLYNALENLLYLVESEETERALVMISSLSRFFQFVTNRREMIIPLWKELDFTQNYLQIMRERFQNFTVVTDVDPAVVNYEVLKLMLQPLVENIIHHGVSETEKLVEIRITVSQTDHTIILEVADDAEGMEEEQLRSIQEDLKASTFNRSGLYNVYDRLDLYYHGQFTFSITSKKNRGTRVTIEIPKQINKDSTAMDIQN